jgi:hypothetical protein
VGDLPSFEVTYTFSKGTLPATSTLYFVFDGSIEYQIILQAATENWQKNAPIFEAMVSSFEPGSPE